MSDKKPKESKPLHEGFVPPTAPVIRGVPKAKDSYEFGYAPPPPPVVRKDASKARPTSQTKPPPKKEG